MQHLHFPSPRTKIYNYEKLATDDYFRKIFFQPAQQ